MFEHIQTKTQNQKRDIFPSIPDVAIIVLNWNGWQDAVECLESLQHLDYPHYQVILVDNGSNDDSVAKIEEWCNGKIAVNTALITFSPELKPIEYIELDRLSTEKDINLYTDLQMANYPPERGLIIIKAGENKGLTVGYNIGIRYALKRGYKYIWLLNNDVVVNRESLIEMVKLAEADAKVGMVGSKFYDYEKPDVVQWLGSNKVIWPHRDRTAPLKKEYIEFKWLSTSSLLVKEEVIKQIGLLDEQYFYYCEDKDWSIKAGKKGWKLCCALKSKVWHKHGASTKSKRINKYFLGRKVTRIPWEGFCMPAYYDSRNSLYLVKRNYPQYLMPYLTYVTLNRIIQIMLYDDHKIARSRIILRSIWDGLIGRMGKVI